MKRPLLIAATLAGLVLMVWAFTQVAANAPVEMARLIPPGPLLYLEAKDLHGLLGDWNASEEKRIWLAGDNYQVFSRSRLFMRLQQAQSEFAAAAGVPPSMDLLENVAGGQSALALYDIGNLEFLFITRMPAERFAASALWKTRGSYQPRQAAGLEYFVKTDTASKRVAAFASAKDYVLLATREDLLAGALSLVAGQSAPKVTEEPWFDKTTRAAKSHGELRMVMNLEKLVRSPYFHSYWIQQNISDMRQYAAAISDASRASGEIREDRVLLRGAEIAPSWNEAAVDSVLRLAPASAGFYQAWASPSTDQAFDLVRRKILEPHPESQAPTKVAPVVALGDGAVGSETDLETRIDEPPLETGSDPTTAEFRKLLEAAKIEAMLEIGATRVQPDGVFVGIDSAVVLLAASDWDSVAVRGALPAALLDGLSPVVAATNGRILVLANRKELLDAVLAGLRNPASGPGARYAAAYRHSQELSNYVRMMRLIDNPLIKETAPDAREPAFFSGNLASLGQTLGRIESESIVVHDTGGAVTQSLVYKIKK